MNTASHRLFFRPFFLFLAMAIVTKTVVAEEPTIIEHDHAEIGSNQLKMTAMGMEIQTLKARENVKHKMLEDKIKKLELSVSEMTARMKTAEEELAFMRRTRR